MTELLEVLGYPVVEVPPDACTTRNAALAFLAGVLVRGGHLRAEDAEAVAAQVAAWEDRGATTLGRGFALPHLMTPAVEAVVGVSGRAAAPIPWPGGGEDGPVRFVTLLLTPSSRPLEMLLAEEDVVRKLFKSARAREQAVRLRAYRYWVAAGRPDGGAEHFWFEAERDLLANPQP